MPTLTTTEPDSYSIDYYYNRYKNRYALGINETKPESFQILPENVKPTECDAGDKKKMHHFIIPKQPIYTTYLYKKYYTNFISQFYKIKTTILIFLIYYYFTILYFPNFILTDSKTIFNSDY